MSHTKTEEAPSSELRERKKAKKVQSSEDSTSTPKNRKEKREDKDENEAPTTQLESEVAGSEQKDNGEKEKEPEGEQVGSGSNIAGSIETMERNITILNRELEKVRAKLVEARKGDQESEEVKSLLEQLVQEKKRVKSLIKFQEASVSNHRWENAKTGVVALLLFMFIHFILYLFDIV